MSSSSPFTRDELRAAAEIHHELGPDYQAAVIDSFLDKVGREIDARVDARMAGPRQFQHARQAQEVQPAVPARAGSPFALAIVSMVLGIPLSAIALSGAAGLPGLLVIWVAITAINVAHSLHLRPPSGRR